MILEIDTGQGILALYPDLAPHLDANSRVKDTGTCNNRRCIRDRKLVEVCTYTIVDEILL